jgi:hypothetical protein
VNRPQGSRFHVRHFKAQRFPHADLRGDRRADHDFVTGRERRGVIEREPLAAASYELDGKARGVPPDVAEGRANDRLPGHAVGPHGDGRVDRVSRLHGSGQRGAALGAHRIFELTRCLRRVEPRERRQELHEKHELHLAHRVAECERGREHTRHVFRRVAGRWLKRGRLERGRGRTEGRRRVVRTGQQARDGAGRKIEQPSKQVARRRGEECDGRADGDHVPAVALQPGEELRPDLHPHREDEDVEEDRLDDVGEGEWDARAAVRADARQQSHENDAHHRPERDAADRRPAHHHAQRDDAEKSDEGLILQEVEDGGHHRLGP